MKTSPEAPIVVIGAGFSGVTSVKACKEEGLHVVGFEKTDDIGGLWRFRTSDVEGLASVMRSTIIDTSKEMEAFSDFPPPQHLANHMHNSDVLGYLELYAKHFDLYAPFRFRHEVLAVDKDPDFAATGRWKIRVKNLQNEEVFEMVASGVMVCIGHHVYPHAPDFQGLSTFGGKVIHSHSYKDSHGFEGKTTLIVGIGNSAMDLAVELSRVCPKVYLSTRRGAWISSRMGDGGMPNDYFLNTRIGAWKNQILPRRYIESVVIKKYEQRFDHALYNLRPEHGPLDQHPSVSDELPSRILAGIVVVKGNVQSFTASGVTFVGEEEREYPVDAVILATGYDIRFPFLPDDVVAVDENAVRLYKLVFPMTVQPPTLAVIALAQPVGAVFTLAEMQARWAVKVFSGERPLPSRAAMEADWARYERQKAHYVRSRRHTIEVEYVPYMDSIADLLGVKPDLLTLFFTDPKLFKACLFGPCVAYQYRLRGPHPWAGARDAILTTDDRIIFPFATRHPEGALRPPRSQDDAWFVWKAMAPVLLLWGLFVAYVVYGSRT